MSEIYDRLPRASTKVFRELMKHLQNTGETSLYGVDFAPLTPEQAEMVIAMLCENQKLRERAEGGAAC